MEKESVMPSDKIYNYNIKNPDNLSGFFYLRKLYEIDFVFKEKEILLPEIYFNFQYVNNFRLRKRGNYTSSK